MPMRFRGATIKCLVMRHGKPMPRVQFPTTHFFGVLGESAIPGDVGGRPLAFPVLLRGDFATRQALELYINTQLNAKPTLLGNGQLEITHGEGDEFQRVPPYKDCTFLGFEMGPDGPLKDVAETIDGGWFCEGVLHFYQLTVD